MNKETIQSFIVNWNGTFSDCQLTEGDLKNSHAVMRALFHVFDRLGIDREAVLAPPPEDARNESLPYYRDLLPVINMTRLINHINTVMPHKETINISHFLQPSTESSYYMLVLLFNLMLFNEERMMAIAPQEEELFGKSEKVKTLEDQKNKLLLMLNDEAQEKGKRAERLEKFNNEIKQYEEDLKEEKEIQEQEKQKLDILTKEVRQMELLIEQKRSHYEGIIAELNRKKALRVYDAEDIKAQAEKAAQNMQEAEEKCESLKETLMQKENSLKNLQTIKPNLDVANNVLREIMTLSENLKEMECPDLDSESAEGELEVLNTEVQELTQTLKEITSARAELAEQAMAECTQREADRTLAMSTLREAVEKDNKGRERCKRSTQLIEELKQSTVAHEQDKAQGFEEINNIKNTFCNALQSAEDTMLRKLMEVEKQVADKLKNHHI